MASTINISLPEPLMEYVNVQVEAGDYGTPGAYIRDLIADDRDRRRRHLEQQLSEALQERSNAIRVPDDVWESGDITAFLVHSTSQQ